MVLSRVHITPDEKSSRETLASKGRVLYTQRSKDGKYRIIKVAKVPVERSLRVPPGGTAEARIRFDSSQIQQLTSWCMHIGAVGWCIFHGRQQCTKAKQR